MSAAGHTANRRSRPNGWWGVLILVASEATLIATLIASYFYLRFTHSDWPPPGTPKPEALKPAILTGVLLLSSWPLLVAARSARDGLAARVRALIVAAMAIQGAYLCVQLHDFIAELDKHRPADDAYSSIYYTLLGAHHAHVLVGLLLLLGILVKLGRGLNPYREAGVRAIVLYWHFTNLAAVAVLLTQLYPVL